MLAYANFIIFYFVFSLSSRSMIRYRECGMPKKTISTAEQDYLEAIHELIETKGYAKVVEIAERLRLKGPSVTRMVQKLSRDGYLNYEKYRGIVMTSQGRAMATDMQNRHRLLRKFLISLGVDAKTADEDAEGMEHHVSPKTLKCLAHWLAESEHRLKK
jgi:Mn-dependent DtxR family transcriptional regulator